MPKFPTGSPGMPISDPGNIYMGGRNKPMVMFQPRPTPPGGYSGVVSPLRRRINPVGSQIGGSELPPGLAGRPLPPGLARRTTLPPGLANRLNSGKPAARQGMNSPPRQLLSLLATLILNRRLRQGGMNQPPQVGLPNAGQGRMADLARMQMNMQGRRPPGY